MYSEKDLCEYLREEIFPQLSPPPYGDIKIYRLASNKPVYLFAEKERDLTVMGKSFQSRGVSLDEAWLAANTEYTNLKLGREKYGMCDDSYEIISPLGEKKELSALLVTRKASGHLLDHYISRAIYEKRQEKLFQKLSYLAQFFARLHANSRTGKQVSTLMAGLYLDKLLKPLRGRLLSMSEIRNIEHRAAYWWNKIEICKQDVEVTVHGDATPTNFFFQQEKVTGIDLESMKQADRCWDLGFIAAELKHHFWWRSGDRWAAEPFIGHFLWEYAVKTDNAQSFYTITGKLPLYMALGLIRMARNKWLSENYRKALVEEAKLCLEYGQ
jgi:hypothetical protein